MATLVSASCDLQWPLYWNETGTRALLFTEMQCQLIIQHGTIHDHWPLTEWPQLGAGAVNSAYEKEIGTDLSGFDRQQSAVIDGTGYLDVECGGSGGVAVGDRVSVDGKGPGDVMFVGKHHIEGTPR